MTCAETRTLIHAYVDGELDLAHSLTIEEHLRSCAACAQVYRNQQTLQAAIGASDLRFTPPADLQKRIQASIRQASKAEPVRFTPPWRLMGLVTAVLVIAVLGGVVVRAWLAPPSNDVLAQEVVASHVRSLMASHLSDVASSDQHTVKPWFNGRLDFSPPVVDLSAQGFPLIGGRLDYLDNRPVAALIYQRQKHFINLFIWPSTDTSDGVQEETLQGYHVYHWDQSGMTFWAVSDLNTTELQQFVQLVQSEAR